MIGFEFVSRGMKYLRVRSWNIDLRYLFFSTCLPILAKSRITTSFYSSLAFEDNIPAEYSTIRISSDFSPKLRT